jgi:histidine phosphotransferase ChpT
MPAESQTATARPPEPAASGLALAELLCARLCHDFSGPLGTLIAAAELIDDAASDQTEVRAAVQDAAQAMSRRLRYLRAAWGSGAAAITPAELAELAEGVPGQGRVRLDLSALPADAPLGPGLSRTLMAAILLAAEALPRGGVVRVLADPAAGRLLLLPEGALAAWPEGVAATLAGRPHAETTPRTLLAPLTRAIAQQAGFSLSLVLAAGDRPGLLAIAGARAGADEPGGH